MPQLFLRTLDLADIDAAKGQRVIRSSASYDARVLFWPWWRSTERLAHRALRGINYSIFLIVQLDIVRDTDHTIAINSASRLQ